MFEITQFKPMSNLHTLKSDKHQETAQIVLARYGRMFRGNKVENAAEAGAAAIVLFKDLAEPDKKERYPFSEYAPSSAGERGTVGS